MKNDIVPTKKPYTHKDQLCEHDTEKLITRIESIRDNYTQHIKPFVHYVRETEGGVNIDTIRQYYLYLNTTGLSASTIRVRRQAVKHRIRDLFSNESEEKQAYLNVQLSKLDKAQSTKCPGGSGKTVNSDSVLQPGELETVIQGCRSERQRLFILFLYQTGARVSELCKTRTADCKHENGYTAIRLHGKGNKTMSEKQRTVYITRELYERIYKEFQGLSLFETTGGKPYDRSYISDQIRKITKKTIGRALSAHKLRHSWATRKVKETGRVKAVSEYLGHSDVNITLKMYTHDVFSPSDILGPEAVV